MLTVNFDIRVQSRACIEAFDQTFTNMIDLTSGAHVAEAKLILLSNLYVPYIYGFFFIFTFVRVLRFELASKEY